ncbi:MAG TPA: hypothetical protein VJ978_01330 [Nitriliruptoraceae bacterium]|nr:hypothetical protein [Nitriliruptoraceae bacterium]
MQRTTIRATDATATAVASSAPPPPATAGTDGATGDGTADDGPAARILTVCLGNVCRSPAAEALLGEAAARSDVPIEVESAGTSVATPGRRANRRMRRAASRIGVTVNSRTRQVRPDDLQHFDLVVAMDRRNLADLVAMRAEHGGRAEIRLLRSFDPSATTLEVPDPFRAPPSFHDSVLACMTGSIDGVVAWAADHVGRDRAASRGDEEAGATSTSHTRAA